MERWGGANNPVVKVAALFAVSLFVALNFPMAFYAVVAAALSYTTVLLALAYPYRKGYGIAGKSELAVRFAAKILVGLKEECSRTVAREWERRQKRKRFQRERKAQLRRYRRERNRKRRKQARKALMR